MTGWLEGVVGFKTYRLSIASLLIVWVALTIGFTFTLFVYSVG